MVTPLSERTDLQEALHIQRGVSVFLNAAALSLIFSPQQITQETIDTTFHRLIPAMTKAYKATMAYDQSLTSPRPTPMPRWVNSDEVVYGMNLSEIQLIGLKAQLLSLLEEKAHLREKLSQTQLVALVGEQGCGKGALGPLFEKYEFSALPMSDLVKDAASALSLNRDETQVKIDIGRELKAIFGDGILVLIGIANALEDGKNRILLEGPRIKGEINQVHALGGVSIGIILDEDEEQDRNKRRTFIENRVTKDPARAKDVASFDKRELQEHTILRRLLMDLPPEKRMINRFDSAEQFVEATKEWLFGSNGLLEQGRK